jgi:Cu(I)/Ag(I) efflux system membrane fusion protein
MENGPCDAQHETYAFLWPRKSVEKHSQGELVGGDQWLERGMPPLILSVGLMLVLAAVPFTIGAATSGPMQWEAVAPEVSVGQGVPIAVRLVDGEGEPIVADFKVTSAHLAMDGMAMMEATLQPARASEPGVVAFVTTLGMAGPWVLTIAAGVDGGEPVEGTVVFTALERYDDTAAATMPTRERRVLYYRDPMGLPDISPVPKKDAMGMDYIPVYEDEVGPPGTVRLSPEKIQRAGVRVEPVEQRALTRTIRGFGTIAPDESRLSVLTAKFDGFVEELFVATTGAAIVAGDPLMRIWIESPEILAKQADYLTALRRGADEVAKAEHNLMLFGIPRSVIGELKETRRAVRSVVVPAPRDGIVLDKPAVVGMRFSVGDPIFRIADLSTVWVLTEIAERDLGVVQVGQTARIKLGAYPHELFQGRITFVYPELATATRAARLRIEMPNDDLRMKIGQYADVVIEASLTDGPVLTVPISAVIDTGQRQVAFVAKSDGVFEPRDLVLGRRGRGYVEVHEGLAEGEQIVVRGNFLIDAESNLRAAIATFTAPEAPVPREPKDDPVPNVAPPAVAASETPPSGISR